MKTPEEILAEAFAKEISKNLTSHIKGLKDEIKQFVNDGIHDYLLQQLGQYGYVKTILHRTHKSFNEIYEPLSLSIKDKIIKTDRVENLFTNSNFITIQGHAGSGKSTLVKSLFVQSVKEDYCIPILIELRTLSTGKNILHSYIKELVTNKHLSANDTILERLLNMGKFIIFLDGFDEVTSDYRNELLLEIDSFMDKYYKNRFVITSRYYSNLQAMQRTVDFEILELDKEQVNSFIRRQVTESFANKIIESLQENKIGCITYFLKNPLLLSLYILTYQTYPSIPCKKSEFYERVVNVLIVEHDSLSKLGYSRPRTTALDDYSLQQAISYFSLISFTQEVFSFKKQFISSTLNDLTAKKLINPINANHFIEDMTLNIALWHKEDNGNVKFIHKSIQEYFASRCISTRTTDSKGKIYSELLSRISNNEYRSAENFLDICNEIDEIDYYKFFKIPLNKKFLELIDDSSLIRSCAKLIFLKSSGFKIKIREDFSCYGFSHLMINTSFPLSLVINEGGLIIEFFTCLFKDIKKEVINSGSYQYQDMYILKTKESQSLFRNDIEGSIIYDEYKIDFDIDSLSNFIINKCKKVRIAQIEKLIRSILNNVRSDTTILERKISLEKENTSKLIDLL